MLIRTPKLGKERPSTTLWVDPNDAAVKGLLALRKRWVKASASAFGAYFALLVLLVFNAFSFFSGGGLLVVGSAAIAPAILLAWLYWAVTMPKVKKGTGRALDLLPNSGAGVSTSSHAFRVLEAAFYLGQNFLLLELAAKDSGDIYRSILREYVKTCAEWESSRQQVSGEAATALCQNYLDRAMEVVRTAAERGLLDPGGAYRFATEPKEN